MIKSTSYAAIGAVMIANMILPVVANAQTYATMPVIYNQYGQQVNAGNTAALPAGYYYLGTGSTQQIYYYGNGTYFNPATGEFGGSVNNPYGQAGMNLGYVTGGSPVYTGTPGVPNTGSGGDALSTWITMALSAVIVLGGATYLVATRRNAHR